MLAGGQKPLDINAEDSPSTTALSSSKNPPRRGFGTGLLGACSPAWRATSTSTPPSVVTILHDRNDRRCVQECFEVETPHFSYPRSWLLRSQSTIVEPHDWSRPLFQLPGALTFSMFVLPKRSLLFRGICTFSASCTRLMRPLATNILRCL